MPYLLGVAAMVVYFVWVCLQMATHASGGKAALLAIFGACAAGVLAMAAGWWRGR